MNRVLAATVRLCKRIWYIHRNRTIARARRMMDKALAQREQILTSIPEDRRDEVIRGDMVLTEALDMAYRLNAFFQTVGVQYEK